MIAGEKINIKKFKIGDKIWYPCLDISKYGTTFAVKRITLSQSNYNDYINIAYEKYNDCIDSLISDLEAIR